VDEAAGDHTSRRLGILLPVLGIRYRRRRITAEGWARLPSLRHRGESTSHLDGVFPRTCVAGTAVATVFAPHGAVTVTRRSGALADEFLWLFTLEGGRIARIEVFSLADVDAALARFEELSAMPRKD
jgi:ketosteroid isomerase-like protein